MAYDAPLAEELRERLRVAAEGELTEKEMFGGLAFMVDGNLTIAASRTGGLLVRTDPADADEVLALEGVEPMENRRAEDARLGLRRRRRAARPRTSLDDWVERSLAFVATLPPK